MDQKRCSEEDILKLLTEIEARIYDGVDLVSACRRGQTF